MANLKILKYQIAFTTLTKKMYEKNSKLYEIAIICIRTNELTKGARMKRKNKPTNSGTTITFEPVKNQEEYKTELEKIISDGEALGLKLEKEDKK